MAGANPFMSLVAGALSSQGGGYADYGTKLAIDAENASSDDAQTKAAKIAAIQAQAKQRSQNAPTGQPAVNPQSAMQQKNGWMQSAMNMPGMPGQGSGSGGPSSSNPQDPIMQMILKMLGGGGGAGDGGFDPTNLGLAADGSDLGGAAGLGADAAIAV